MTITVAPTRNEYTATAGQTVFTYTFKIFTDADLNVYVTPAGQLADDSTDQVTPSTVTGVGDPNGGTITIPATSLNDLVTIVGDIPANRTTDYQNNGDFSPDVVNSDFDRVVSLVKQVEDVAGRSLVFPESQQDTQQLSLPSPEGGKFVRWRGDLLGLENVAPTTTPIGTNVASISGLRNLDINNFSAGDSVFVDGYYTTGDGGGGPRRILFTGQAPGFYIDNGGTIIVPAGGDGSTAWLWDYSGNINSRWFGVFPDFGTGNTDQTASMKAAIDACPIGGVVETPDGQYYFASHLTLEKYMTFQGIASAGFASSTRLVFDNTDGIHVTEDYVTIKDMQVWGATNPTTVVTDPETNTWGNIGLTLSYNDEPSPNFIAEGVHFAYFNTGLLSNADVTHDPYYKFINCKWFFNNINISLLGTFPGTFTDCDVRLAHQHGLYARDTQGIVFKGGVWEQNGNANLTFPIDPNADYYGVFVQNDTASRTDIQFSNTYYEVMNSYADVDTRITFNSCTFNQQCKNFGQGYILYSGRGVTQNMLPQDLSERWRYTGNPTITDEGYYTRFQMTEGTTMQMYLEDRAVQNTVIPQDVRFEVISMEVRVVNGYQDGSFDITPTVVMYQSTGDNDSTDPDKDYNRAEWDFTGGEWQTISFIHAPRLIPGGGNLDPTVFDLERITTLLRVDSSDFSINNLDIHVRNVSLKLITDKDLTPTHSIYNGFKAPGLLVQRSTIKIDNMSGTQDFASGAIPAGSVLIGVTAVVTKTITGPASLHLGDGSSTTLFASSMGLTAGTAITVADSNGFTSPKVYTVATSIVATSTGVAFTGGDLVVEAWYIKPTQPGW